MAKDVQKTIHTMLKNSTRAYALVIAEMREEIQRNINIRKQYEVIYYPKVQALENMDMNIHPEEYEELNKEVKNLAIKLHLQEEIIATYQLGLIEQGTAEDSDFEN